MWRFIFRPTSHHGLLAPVVALWEEKVKVNITMSASRIRIVLVISKKGYSGERVSRIPHSRDLDRITSYTNYTVRASELVSE